MLKVANKIVKFRVPIFLLGLVLLIPSLFGYLNTKVNYDVLTYLPKDIETMQGQDILEDQFGTGAFSLYVVEGMSDKDVAALKTKIEGVDHVSKVIWYDSAMDLTIPKSMLPEKLYNAFNSGDATMMAIIFDETSSEDGTMQAVHDIRAISNEQCFLSGMSSIVVDTKELADREAPIYIAIAVALSFVVLALMMDSFMIPLLFLFTIGMAIMYNMGTNIFLGQISYLTKAIAAVLQLGVTMDYSIFLWHSFEENRNLFPGDNDKAMAHAIANTFVSVIGSSVTTIAGFIALCFMTFRLGLDLGIVMAKGVLFGVICCTTILPSVILIFEKLIEKTRHKVMIPPLERLSGYVTRHYAVFTIVALIALIPAVYGYNHTQVYYNLGTSLPKDLSSMVAESKVEDEFGVSATHMVLVDASTDDKDVRSMVSEMENVDGVKFVLSLDSLIGPTIPESMVPSSIKDMLQSGQYKLMLIGSEYVTASDEVNAQCTRLSSIIKSYDSGGMLVGEAPLTKDLISITDTDFKVVSSVSIAIIFFIIAMVFKSASLPVILVAVIEEAIIINMGIPFYTGTKLPFIASIIIGTIQLGSTVDYAILMTSRYQRERNMGRTKKDAVVIAHQASVKSIFVSALSFFAATFGVGMYSDIDIISSMCILMARGALISMTVVIFILPSMYMIFDKVIIKSTVGLRDIRKKLKEEKRLGIKEGDAGYEA